jgi:FMN phosphatase YigB (HAD superfamily)
MNVQAEDVLFVGDEFQRDIHGACNIGMKTAWIIRDPVKTKPEDQDISPDYTISSLLELKDILLNYT